MALQQQKVGVHASLLWSSDLLLQRIQVLSGYYFESLAHHFQCCKSISILFIFIACKVHNLTTEEALALGLRT